MDNVLLSPSLIKALFIYLSTARKKGERRIELQANPVKTQILQKYTPNVMFAT